MTIIRTTIYEFIICLDCEFANKQKEVFLVRWENYVVGEMLSEIEQKEKETEEQQSSQNVQK